METRSTAAAKRRRMLYPSEDDLDEFLPIPAIPQRRTRAATKLLKDTCMQSATNHSIGMASGPRFRLFPNLPPELRFYIWKLWKDMAMPGPHPLRVRLYRGYDMVGNGSSSSSSSSRRDQNNTNNSRRRGNQFRSALRLTPMPELSGLTLVRRRLLRICREVRYEYLREWPDTVTLNGGGELRFSAQHDIIFLDIRNLAVIDEMVSMRARGETPAFTQVIGHIGFEMVPRMPHWSFHGRTWLDPRLEFILCFPRLHSLSLVTFDKFEAEVDWDLAEDVQWLLARLRSHRVHFRRFAALEGADYTRQTTVGRRAGGGTEKHDCVICTIHKCVYVRDFLRNTDVDGRPQLTDDENDWLAGLSFHSLIMGSPEMGPFVKPYVDRLTSAQRIQEYAEDEALMKAADEEDD